MAPQSTPRPSILSLRIVAEQAEAVTHPESMYSRAAANRAISRIGREGYIVLRTKAFHSITGQLAALDNVIGPLEDLIAATDAWELLSDEEKASRPERERIAVEFLGIETHWHAIHRVGAAVESLCALVAAIEAYRDGLGPLACSRLLLRQELDFQNILQSKRMRRLSQWERLSGRPSLDNLIASGVTETEAKALLQSNRTWSGKMLRRFAIIAGYYTAPLHQVYAKYRHGYTLVNPRLSPLFVMLDGRAGPAVEQAVADGFVVLHESHDGRRGVHVVKTGVDEIKACLDMARFILDVTKSLATAWLVQLEHPDERTIAFEEFNARTIARWLGTGLDDVYDLTNQIASVEEPEGS